MADKFPREIATAEKLYAGFLKSGFDNQKILAEGAERRSVTEKWAPAGTITRQGPLLYKNNEPMLGRNGKALLGPVPIYPNLPPDQMVLVERTEQVIHLEPHAEILKYMSDRALGKPMTQIDAQVSGPDGGPIPVGFQISLEKAYGSTGGSLIEPANTSDEPPT